MINKKTLFIGSGFMLGALYFLQYLASIGIVSCGDDLHLTCYFFLQHLNAFGFGLIPLFILSGVTYFVKENVFYAWMKLVYVYLFLLILAASTLSSSNGDYVGSSDLFYALMLIISFFIVSSIILIVWKWFSARRTKNKN